jgi:hypothetical protein
MNGDPSDQALLEIVSTSTPATIDDVINVMQKIDSALPSNDGIKWFNLLYLLVTKKVLANQPENGWADAAWLARLDVVFAILYFSEIRNLSSHAGGIPSSWSALFEARHQGGIDRIQFALAGMNAHINHDLPLALVQTNEELGLDPDLTSREHNDFEQVNNILEALLPEALQFLATGILGEIAQDSGKIGRVLAMWNVRKARDTAWENANILRLTEELPPVHDRFIAVLDRVTGLASRGLLLPIQ